MKKECLAADYRSYLAKLCTRVSSLQSEFGLENPSVPSSPCVLYCTDRLRNHHIHLIFSIESNLLLLYIGSSYTIGYMVSWVCASEGRRRGNPREEGVHLIALCNGLVAIVKMSFYLLLALDESISVDTKHEFRLFIWFECRGDDYIIARRNTEPSRHLKSNKYPYLLERHRKRENIFRHNFP